MQQEANSIDYMVVKAFLSQHIVPGARGFFNVAVDSNIDDEGEGRGTLPIQKQPHVSPGVFSFKRKRKSILQEEAVKSEIAHIPEDDASK